MARGATKRNAGPKPDASPPKRPDPGRTSAAAAIENQLFFTRIRRRAKWVFVFLAVVFVLSFVLFGVGSGSSGLGDLLNGSWIFGSGGNQSTTPGIRKAQSLIAKNPGNPDNYRTLATAYQTASKPDLAVAPLTKYTQLRPKDSDALLELAALYAGKATRLQTEAQARQQLPLVQNGSLFLPDSSTDLGRALATDPISQASQSIDSTKLSAVYGQINDAYAKQVDIYKKLVALDPQDGSLLVQLANAEQQSGDTAGAIAAYKKFLKLAPDDPLVSAVQQQLKSLQPAPTPKAKVPAPSGK